MKLFGLYTALAEQSSCPYLSLFPTYLLLSQPTLTLTGSADLNFSKIHSMPVILKSNFGWQTARSASLSWCYGASSFGGAVLLPTAPGRFPCYCISSDTTFS